MTFGIRLQSTTDPVDRRLLANAGQHILERPLAVIVIKDLIGREQRHANSVCNTFDPRKTSFVIAMMEKGGEPHIAGTCPGQTVQCLERRRLVEAMRQRNDAELSFGEIDQIGQREMAFAFIRLQLPTAEQLA